MERRYYLVWPYPLSAFYALILDSGLHGWVLKIFFKKYYFNIFLNKKYFKNTVTNTV